MTSDCDALREQVDVLRQALWDVYKIIGGDTDGNETPASVVDLPDVVVRAVREFRDDCDTTIFMLDDRIVGLEEELGSI